MKTALTPLEDLEGLGPAMRGISPFQRSWVLAKLIGLDDTKAYVAAGGTPGGAKAHSWQFAQSETIQAALREATLKLNAADGPKSFLVLRAIRDNPQEKASDRIKASVELLNRGGFPAVSESHHLVEHQLSEAEIDRQTLAFARELGLSPDEAKKLLVDPRRITELVQGADGTYEPAPLSDTPKAVSARATRQRRKGMTPAEIAADKARIRAERANRGKAEYQAAQAAQQTDIEEYIAGLGDEDSNGDPFKDERY